MLREAAEHELIEGIGSAEIELIKLLHPPASGFTAFAVGDGEGLVLPRFAVRSKALSEQVPVHLNRNSYISINQSGCVTEGDGQEIITGQPTHRTETIRHLNAAYVDLDYYGRPGLTEYTALAELRCRQNAREIPPPSLLIYSGRGIWAMWLLNEAVLATREALDQHRLIQQNLHKRLASLGSDSAALSTMRYVRMPGSLNTKSETVVRWEVQTDGNCAMPRYTLSELLRWLEPAEGDKPILDSIVKKCSHQTYRPDENTGLRRGQAGWRALRDRRYRDFKKLIELRGGFRPGCRNQALFYFGILLSQSGTSIERAKELAQELNAHFSPPLKSWEVHMPIVSAYSRKYKRVADQTIADWLRITPEEAGQLECKVIATCFQQPNVEPDIPKPSRKQVDKERMVYWSGQVGQHAGSKLTH